MSPTRNFLLNRANQLLAKVEDMMELRMILSACLMTNNMVDTGEDTKQEGRGNGDDNPLTTRQTKAKPIENTKLETKWCFPSGKKYTDVFV